MRMVSVLGVLVFIVIALLALLLVVAVCAALVAGVILLIGALRGKKEKAPDYQIQ